MRKVVLPAIAVMFVISCSLFVPTAAPPENPPVAQVPAATEAPAATETLVPTAEPTSTLVPTLEPTVVPTAILVPQQWNGTYTYPTGQKQRLSFLIEKINGTKFTGKMIWQSFDRFKGAILKMNGEYIVDFGDGLELTRWNNLPDYQDGIKTGTWLKWTETEVISGSNYTTNGWYYAHIRDDGTMVAVYFYNKDEIVADVGSFKFEQVVR
jgi:hypothetical protein